MEPKIFFLALYFINCQIVQFLCVFLKLDDVRVIKLNGLFLYLLYSFIILLIDDGVLCEPTTNKVVLDLEASFIFLKT